jgi:predicted transcriptional regulator
MRNPLVALGGTEMEVLRHVWALGTASVRDVHDRMAATRTVAYTTVMTVMKNLADKGLLAYEADGGAYHYRAAVAPDAVRGGVLAGILDKVFGGSPSALVQTLVQQESLTDADRAAIRRLLDAMPGDADRDEAPDSDA